MHPSRPGSAPTALLSLEGAPVTGLAPGNLCPQPSISECAVRAAGGARTARLSAIRQPWPFPGAPALTGVTGRTEAGTSTSKGYARSSCLPTTTVQPGPR